MSVLKFSLPDVRRKKEPVSFSRCMLVLGNGDELKGYQLLDRFIWRLLHARDKHPKFAEGKYHALGVIASEYRELKHAVERESDERAYDEALDVMVTAFRFVAGEHEE